MHALKLVADCSDTILYPPFPTQVARVPELHIIDAVLSPEDKHLLMKDGLNSCALRWEYLIGNTPRGGYEIALSRAPL